MWEKQTTFSAKYIKTFAPPSKLAYSRQQIEDATRPLCHDIFIDTDRCWESIGVQPVFMLAADVAVDEAISDCPAGQTFVRSASSIGPHRRFTLPPYWYGMLQWWVYAKIIC